jgi:hypothetical protein
MGIKAWFGLTVVPAAILGGIVLATLSKRIRDVFFIAFVFLSVVIESVDVNFVSREWYRGSSRGFEVSIPGILALCVLAGCILTPRRNNVGVQASACSGTPATSSQANPRLFWPASFGFMLLFFGYACVNVAMVEPKLFGLFELFKMTWGLIVFLAVAVYLRSERELRLLVLALGLVVCFEGVVAVGQRYWSHIHRVYGTLDDSNSLSMFLCTTAPVLMAAFNSRIPRPLKALCALAIGLAAVAEIMTISRAGVVTMGTVLLCATVATMSFKFTAKRIVIALLCLLAVSGLLAKSWKTLAARFGESTLKVEYGSQRSMGRGYYIRIAALIVQDTRYGVGLNNWSYWVSNKYGPKLGYHFTPYPGPDREPSYKIAEGAHLDDPQAAPAHSLGALTVGELGWTGLVLFALLWLRWFQMSGSFLWPRVPAPMRRVGVGIFFGFCGIFAQSLTEWVFRQLPIYYTFHILLGALASLYCLKKLQNREARRARAQPSFPVVRATPSELVA